MKKKIIIANLKLNGNLNYIKKYIKKLKKYSYLHKNNIFLAPPILYLYYATKLIKKSNINLVSQNIDINLSGSFTGEISAEMIKDIKIKYIIIGHSERKKYHKENNEIILNKIIITKKLNLIPIICIGENIDEYKKNKSIITCKEQIDYIIKNKNIHLLENSIIAYEPIWAIGTGKNANINHINKIHQFIIKYLYSINKNIINKIKIIYGGSINKKNVFNILNNNNVYGLLIGKSSWNIKDFIKILNTINIKNKH